MCYYYRQPRHERKSVSQKKKPFGLRPQSVVILQAKGKPETQAKRHYQLVRVHPHGPPQPESFINFASNQSANNKKNFTKTQQKRKAKSSNCEILGRPVLNRPVRRHAEACGVSPPLVHSGTCAAGFSPLRARFRALRTPHSSVW